MASALVLTQFTNLRLDGAAAGTEWELMPGLTLSTRKDKLEAFLTPEVQAVIGGLSSFAFLEAQHFVYGVFSDSDIAGMFSPECKQPQSTQLLMETALVWLRNFLRASWLVKDNAIVIEGAYVVYPHEGSPRIASFNSLFELNITCAGRKKELCVLTEAELSKIIDIHHRLETALWENRDKHGDTLRARNARIDRCFELLRAARSSLSIPLRIAHYCSAFESLFASGTTELRHRLSERVAHFAASTPEERLKVYEVAKRAYDLRSQVVHGSSISKKSNEEIISICVDTDNLLRTILLRLVAESEMWDLLSSSDERIDRFFLGRLMGCLETGAPDEL